MPKRPASKEIRFKLRFEAESIPEQRKKLKQRAEKEEP